MTRRVYKYLLSPLSIESLIIVRMPRRAQVLSAGVQGRDIVVWAMIDSAELETELREFHVIGTGHDADHVAGLRFINTIFIGPYVFHVFEK